MAETDTQPETSWQYKPDGSKQHQPEHVEGPQMATVPTQPKDRDQEVTWTASEFIHHHKGIGWYLVLLLIGAVFGGLIYIITRDTITLSVIVVCFIAFGIVAARKPRVLAYRLDRSGLTIGSRNYPYGTFKAFALVDEGTFTSIAFLPLKRFNPSINVYFAPEDESRIVDVLSMHLPLEQGQLDLFETLIRRIRF